MKMTFHLNEKNIKTIPIIIWQNGKSKDYSFQMNIPPFILNSLNYLKEHIADYISTHKHVFKKDMNLTGSNIKRIFNNNGVEIDEYDLMGIKPNDLLFISFDISAPFCNSNYYNQYELIKWIKSGGYGQVFLARHIFSKKEYAIKQINTQNCNGDDIQAITKENLILQSLKHKHIIKYYQYFFYDDCFYTVMDYAKGGELSTLLKERNRLNEKHARDIFKQIYKAVCFIHTKNIIHRDLKPNNILFLDEKRTHVVLIDFGISGIANGNNKDIVKAGTTRFLAPEIASGDNFSSSPKLDVWSLGVILFKMVQGKFPFDGKNDSEIKKMIMNYPIQFNRTIKISEQCKELIKGLLEKTISFRLNMDSKKFVDWFDFDKVEEIERTCSDVVLPKLNGGFGENTWKENITQGESFRMKIGKLNMNMRQYSSNTSLTIKKIGEENKKDFIRKTKTVVKKEGRGMIKGNTKEMRLSWEKKGGNRRKIELPFHLSLRNSFTSIGFNHMNNRFKCNSINAKKIKSFTRSTTVK